MSENLSTEERALVRGEAMQADKLSSLQGWYPVVVRDDRLWWRFFGDKRFSEPFFHDTVSKLPQDKKFCVQTSLDALEEFGDALAPTAIIFHISRCGSTLLTQLLATLPSCTVMSEPPAIDSFLRQHYAQPGTSGAERTLRRIVSTLGQKRFAQERHFFVKLDSWHIASLPIFRAAFPDTPFVFLYRTPDEVLASHRRQRGRQMVPGLVNAAMPSCVSAPLPPGDLDGYCVSVLTHFFREGLQHANDLMLINYSQLPGIVWSDMLDLFGISPSAAELETMKSRSGLHSKNAAKFTGDPQSAADLIGERCAALYPYYDELERLRLARDFRSSPTSLLS